MLDQIWMGVLLILVGIPSSLLSLVFSIALFRRRMHTFNAISSASLLCVFISAIVYLICGILILESINIPVNSSPIPSGFLPVLAGCLQVYAELTLILLHCLSSSNRLAAIAFPFKYQKMFSEKRTLYLIILLFLLPFPVLPLLSSGIGSCINSYDAVRLFWFRERGTCQYWLAMVECSTSYLLTTATFLVDLYCVLALKISKNPTLRNIAKTEMKYAVQTLVVGVAFWVCTLSYYLAGVRAETTPVVMFASSSVKTLSSILSGLIICAMNRSCLRLSPSTSATTTLTMASNRS